MTEKAEADIQRHYSARLREWIAEYEAPRGYPFSRVRLERLKRFVEHRHIPRRSILDVGCGVGIPGQELLEAGGSLRGFDLSSELVEYARERARRHGLDAEYAVGSVEDAESYSPGQVFDTVLSLGVFQHVCDDLEVLGHMRTALAPDGWMAVSFRNPLFGLITFNRPSYELFRELFAEFAVGPEAGILEQFLKRRFDLALPPQRRGQPGDPGIDDIVYRYHNPLVVSDLFREAGLRVEAIDFYRHHAVPPMLEKEAPDRFRELSMAADGRPNDWRSWFLCSTYLVYARHLRA